MPASASDSVRASAMTPTMVVQPGLAALDRTDDALADRILVGPVGARGGLVDDRDGGCVFNILLGEEASTQESHAEHVEIFR